jgi:hypothetical protein
MTILPRSVQTLLALTILGGLPHLVAADEPVRLQERFPPGYQYQVSARVELSGTLTLPPEKDDAGKPRILNVTGKSALDYDEKVLSVEPGEQVSKSARVYRRVDFERKIGEQEQHGTLRLEVRRLVVLRNKQAEVPFSPDGPLTWGEIDLVRTDVFTPALAGLLPQALVKPGDRWQASQLALQELTDLEQVQEGSLSCTFEQITTLGKRRYARVGFKGTVRGLGEDGLSRHQVEGYFFFDLESHHLSYLSLRGVQSLLDQTGKALGKVEGNFVLTRQPLAACKELSAQAWQGVSTEPNEENTLLLYDHPELGIRFLHSRRWRVAGVRGRQVAVDDNKGSGLLLTLEPLKQLPTGAAFLQESRTWLQQQKVAILRTDAPRLVQAPPKQLEHFALDVQIGKERVLMEYYVSRQGQGGATLAARLLFADLATTRRDVERIARTLEITRPQ